MHNLQPDDRGEDANVLGDNFWDKFLDAEIIDPILMKLIALP
ncbi:hypothetical protein A2U01_0116440, partial [Trifolium medium]|nr:hypothetical protein [Trifolium medium]